MSKANSVERRKSLFSSHLPPDGISFRRGQRTLRSFRADYTKRVTAPGARTNASRRAASGHLGSRPSLSVLYFPIFRVPEYSELSIRSELGADEFRSVDLLGSEYSALPI